MTNVVNGEYYSIYYYYYYGEPIKSRQCAMSLVATIISLYSYNKKGMGVLAKFKEAAQVMSVGAT